MENEATWYSIVLGGFVWMPFGIPPPLGTLTKNLNSLEMIDSDRRYNLLGIIPNDSSFSTGI